MRNYQKEHKDNDYRKYHYNFDTFNRQKLIQAFEPYFKSGSSLEIGAFRGVMTNMLSTYFEDLTVVEAAPDLATALQCNFPKVKVINSLVEDWQTDQKFENIFLVHTLEHIENRVEVLQGIRNLLTDTGYLFIAVPNARALSRLIAVEMGLIESAEAITEGERLHGHTITYSTETLTREINYAGLRIIHQGGVIVKTLSNFQIDAAIENGIISLDYLDACNRLSVSFPEFSSSIFAVVQA